MNAIILTGVSRGLGLHLHDLLIQKNLPSGERIFFSRSAISTTSKMHQYIYGNLATMSEYDFNFNISSNVKCVIFINNASVIAPIKKSENVSAAELLEVWKVNCQAPFLIAKKLTAKTKEIGAKLIILDITSGAAKNPIKGWVAYCSSKAAIRIALDVLDEENDHVKVSHIDPGVMNTDMQVYIREQSVREMPDVDKFRAYKINSDLKEPGHVAENIIAMIKNILI